MIMYLLDKQQNIIKAISDGIIEAKMTEEINAADKLVFSLVQNMRLPDNIYYICISAIRGDAFLMFKIISESVQDDRVEYTCIESAYDELKSYAYIKDVRPQDKTAGEMLQVALTGTRWEPGYVANTARKRTNFYYISTLEALQKIVEVFQVEMTFSIIIDPNTNRIVRRQVNLYAQQGERTGKRFEYGSNLLSVTREESSEDLVTALVGRGKGEQLDDGNDDTVDGYGRRIMFTDVVWRKANGNPTDKPAGQEYVEDKEATKLYGFDDGKPRIGIAVFEDIEDVNQLINATWAALQVAKRPKVSFKASALDVGELGLGDTVAIIRHELNIEYFTRVYKVEHDLLDKNNNVIELGDDFSEKSLTNYVASVKEAQEETSRVANIALTSANGKNKNFYSNVKPTIAAEGDNLFLDLGNGETEYYVYRNGNWKLVLSTAVVNETKKEVDRAVNEIDNVRNKANEAFSIANSASSNANSLHQQMLNLQTSFDTAISDTEIKLKAQAKEEAKKALDKAQKLSDDYTASMRDVNAELLALNNAKNKANTDINKLVTELSGVRGLYSNLDGRITQFNAGVDGLSAQLTDAKKQLASVKLTADGANAKFANQNNEIARLKTRAGTIEQQMLSKVDNNLFESFKSSTAKELKERLTATDLSGYVKTAELTRTADGIRASVSAIDDKISDLNNQNLVYNSEFRNNADEWEKSNYRLSNDDISYTSDETGSWKGSAGLKFRNTSFSDGRLTATSKRIKIDNNVRLSASVHVRVTDFATAGNNTVQMQIVFFSESSGGNYVGSSNALTQSSNNVRNGYSQLLYCDDISVPERARYVAIRLTTNGIGNFIFNQPMLTISDQHLPYTQDQNMFDTLQNRYSELDVKIDAIRTTVVNKADMSYVEQKASEINSLVSTKAEKSYVEQKANEIKTTVSTKADISYVTQKVNEINSVVANKADSSFVIQKANEINNVVKNKSDISYVNQKVSEINSAVANKADISLVTQTANVWQAKLEDLQIGGTNLLANTSQDPHKIVSPTTGNFSEGVVYITSQALNDKKYTLSFEAKADSANQYIEGYFYSHGLGGTNGVMKSVDSSGETKVVNKGDGNFKIKLTNFWKRYWITYDFVPDNTKKGVIVGRRFKFSNPIGSVYIKNVKLELGDKATDYSPAPEDSIVAISAVRTDLTNAINLRVQKNELLSQINLQAGHTLIQSNKIYLDAESVAFSGKAFIPSAAITDLTADKIKTGRLDAAKVSIINLDVNRLVGNTSSFVSSAWRNVYGQYVEIDGSGMRVTYGNTTTSFHTMGMRIKAVNEAIGGIGWNNMVGMPSTYQGLLFWLDGAGDYMAWAARDMGNFSMNPTIKFAWYRKEWLPSGQHAGFSFSDPVTFREDLRVWGNIYGKGSASGGDTHLHFQTYSDGSAGLVNDLDSGFIIKNNGDVGLLRNGRALWLAGKSIATFNSEGVATAYWTI